MVEKDCFIARVRALTSKWTMVHSVVCALVLVPLLTLLRVPCTIRNDMTARAVLLGSILLILGLPAVWFLCRAILGRILGTAGFIAYGLITLFPYRFLFPDQRPFCTWVAAPPNSVLGPGWFVLVLLVLVAAGATAFIYRRELRDRIQALPGIRVGILVLLIFSAVTQVAVRYGSRSPKSVDGGWHIGSTPYNRAYFWNIRYGGGDHALHVTPAGLFRGVGAPKDYNQNNLKINRRSVGPFLYAQLTPYLDPYAAAVAVNFLFYLIIVLGDIASPGCSVNPSC